MRIGLIHEDQRGISLIEMVTVLALIGLLGAAIVMTLAQVLNVSSSSSNRMIAVRQVQQAGKEVSKDVLQSRTVVCGCPGFGLNLTWMDHTDNSHEVTYTIDDGRLLRSHTKTFAGVVVEEASNVIAQYISQNATSCSPCGVVTGKILFRVTAQVGDHFETRTYEIQPRPTG